MIELAICDDSNASVETIKNAVDRFASDSHQNFHVTVFAAPSALFSHMQTNNIDIIFMDLEFNDRAEDGILWSAKINQQFPETLILILTAYENRYKEGYIVRAYRFMTKPLIAREFEENMNACLRELTLREATIIVHQGTKLTVPLKNIIYFSAYYGGSELHTTGSLIYSDDSLLQWENKLMHSSFFRCHKRYLINLYHIESLDNHYITMSNADKLSVSRRKWTSLQNSFIKYDLTRDF